MRVSVVALGGVLVLAASAAAQTLPPQPPLAGLAMGPRVPTPIAVACTDLPTITRPTSPLRIVAAHASTTHEAYAAGEIVVLNGGTPLGLLAGQRYFIRRLEPGRHALPIGPGNPAAIRTAGWLTVVAADEHSALARIDYSCDAALAGDYLDPYVAPALPAIVEAVGPDDFSRLGRVLFGVDRRESFGAGDLLSIDRGSADGVTAGMRIGIYRDRQIGTPLVEMGAGVVMEVSPETSKVVLTRTRDAVHRGDYVAMRQR